MARKKRKGNARKIGKYLYVPLGVNYKNKKKAQEVAGLHRKYGDKKIRTIKTKKGYVNYLAYCKAR
jgi:hypothetical protein